MQVVHSSSTKMKHLIDRLLSYSNLPSHYVTKQLHSLLITSSTLLHNLQLLINSYSFHSDLPSARLLLYQTQTRQPVILYNSLIRSHARTRQFSHSFFLFTCLLGSATKPDSFTFATILRACSDNFDTNGLRAIHGLIISSGFASDLIPITTLLSSYSKVGLLDSAVLMFDEMPQLDLVLYNSMLSGFGYGGFWKEGLELFSRMRRYGEMPDGYSLVGLISCFWDPDSVQFARGVHGLVLKGGFESNSHVRSVLVSMYSRLDCLDSGYRIFRSISCPDLITWSATITGFIQVGKRIEALKLFRELNVNSIRMPDSLLIASILSGCASIAAIGYGLGSNGLGLEANEVFDKMSGDGFRPDKATFSGLLCACAHSGLLEDGSRLFARMRDEFGIEPEMEHYVYMVKLMGLVGKLDKAYELIEGMPKLLGSGSGVWGAFLWGCGLHGRSDLAEIAGRRLFEIDPEKGAYRVMLSNVYASEEKWGNVQSLREKMEGEKVIGLSWV